MSLHRAIYASEAYPKTRSASLVSIPVLLLQKKTAPGNNRRSLSRWLKYNLSTEYNTVATGITIAVGHARIVEISTTDEV